MTVHARPLSPHLQIYRPQLTAVTSISHRLSGLFLCAGAVLLAVWLLALAAGPETYARFESAYSGIPGKVLTGLFVLALSYHFLNGIRHLVWDTGRGLELKAAYASGWSVVILTPLVSALVLWLLWA